MLQRSLSLMLAVLLVLTLAGGATAAVPKVGGTITVTGPLEYVTNLSAPHYEVAGYVLITQDQLMLQSSAGQEVVVVGTPVTEPSIYMRKAITVQSLMTKAAYIPPKPKDGEVTLPVIREPNPPKQPDLVTKPEMPEILPLWGTRYSILFGRIEKGAGAEVLTMDTPTGAFRLNLRSDTVDLGALAGEPVGLVVLRDIGIEVRYNVISAVVLTGDLSSMLDTNLIYKVPDRPITISLRGKEVPLDQRPILGNGRTLVPLRAIGEALGAAVTWNALDLTATVSLSDRVVKVTIGSNRVLVHDPVKGETVIYCDTAPVVVGGRTLVPVRVIAEGLGLTVGWDEATSTVSLQ